MRSQLILHVLEPERMMIMILPAVRHRSIAILEDRAKYLSKLSYLI